VSKATRKPQAEGNNERCFALPGKVQVQSKQGGRSSGVAGGQVKATKYIVFRYVASMFFTCYVCKFHGKPCISGSEASLGLSPVTSIAYERVKKQGNRTIRDGGGQPQGQQDDRKDSRTTARVVPTILRHSFCSC
jgi:hypothetical protein